MLKGYLVKNPFWFKYLYPSGLNWKMPAEENAVYLTFDDGPHPEITSFVTEQLDLYNAKGTFFCIGDNVRKYPAVFADTIRRGHTVGNHTYNHLNGWKTDKDTYLQNIQQADALIAAPLFRPPYGRLSFGQARQIKDTYPSWQTYMWDVISGDFDKTITPEQCTANVLEHIGPGSIVVFHDSEKAFPRLRTALPKVLEYCQQQDWTMKALSQK